MVIIKRFTLERKENSNVFYVRSKEEKPCPFCGEKLQVIGSRRRMLMLQDATTIYLKIRRLRCIGCQKISHELPNIVIPYKRYEAKTIENVLSDEQKTKKESPCPAEASTIQKWKHWFVAIKMLLEEIRIAGNEACDIQKVLKCLCDQEKGWFATIISELVNHNIRLQTRMT